MAKITSQKQIHFYSCLPAVEDTNFPTFNNLCSNSYFIQKNCGLKVKVKWLSYVQLFVPPCAVAYQVRPSMGFSRQEYWSELPFPSPGYLPDPGIEPLSLAL